ncbi:hypothetical protein BD410DRAFT_825563 [Rickenella mellea]|uniref:Uncharacterized protein n=1 Tax=Rickenella mellea TaxID=50990 RepID=A0A4Y7QIB9_9AGAM|nr:hypothetical protein BD410DRAFT_825563 [Rickenella mellea]
MTSGNNLNALPIVVENDTIYPPIHRLPPETMSKIFLSCLEPSVTYQFNIPRCSVRSPPLSISFVCHSWRTLSLQTPRLWAAIAIGHEDGMFDIARVKEWMARSRRCPFLIELTLPRGILNHQKDIVPIIAENSSRWKALRLRIPNSTPATERLIPWAADSVPQLEEFRLEFYSPHSFIRWRFQDSLFHQLSTLCLQGSQFPFRVNSQRPCSLQHVFIDALEGAEAFLAIIDNCPFPQVLECTIVSMGADYIPPPAVLASTTMHTLKISSDDYNIGQLLETLHLPNLESLSMDRGRRAFPTLSPHLQSMINYSRPPLREVGIWGDISAEDVIEILRLVPGLRSIGGDIMFTQSDFAVVRAMVPYVPRNRPLCPQVEKFTVHLPDDAYRKFAWMLSSRWDHAIPQTSGSILSYASLNERAVSPPLNVVILGNEDDGETFSRVLGVSRCVSKGTKVTTQSFESLLYHPSF